MNAPTKLLYPATPVATLDETVEATAEKRAELHSMLRAHPGLSVRGAQRWLEHNREKSIRRHLETEGVR